MSRFSLCANEQLELHAGRRLRGRGHSLDLATARVLSSPLHLASLLGLRSAQHFARWMLGLSAHFPYLADLAEFRRQAEWKFLHYGNQLRQQGSVGGQSLAEEAA
jgi:hypothetical protein